MHTRIENDTDFKSKIKNKLFELLKAIKMKMYDPSKVKNPFITLTEQMERMLTTKQEEDESITEYVKRFKQARDNFKELIGKTFLHEFVETTAEYKKSVDSSEQDQLKANRIETWMAYLLLKNSDSNKYGSLKKNFRTQYALNNDQYPKKVSSMTDVLNSHQWDATYNENKKKRRINVKSRSKNQRAMIRHKMKIKKELVMKYSMHRSKI